MREKSPDSRMGTAGWVALGAFVVAFDVLAKETLSSAVDRALEHPWGRVVAIGGVAITGAHLLNLLPEDVDPFVKTFELLGSRR